MSAFAVVLVLSNVLAIKLFKLGPFVFPAGTILFPVSYILGDVLTEVYGYRGAQRVFLTGIGANLLMSLVFFIAVRLPGVNPEVSESFRILDQVPRLVLASILGVWAGQHANAAVLSRLKVLTRGKFLWVRTISSTFVGEGVDTAVFAAVGFLGVVPLPVLVTMVWSAALVKSLYEAVITPITYIVVSWWKGVEKLDVYDERENYNPLVLKPTPEEVQ